MVWRLRWTLPSGLNIFRPESDPSLRGSSADVYVRPCTSPHVRLLVYVPHVGPPCTSVRLCTSHTSVHRVRHVRPARRSTMYVLHVHVGPPCTSVHRVRRSTVYVMYVLYVLHVGPPCTSCTSCTSVHRVRRVRPAHRSTVYVHTSVHTLVHHVHPHTSVHHVRPASVTAFLNRFFISWEIKYLKPPKYLTR